MAQLNKKLHIVRAADGTEKTVDLYTTQQETGNAENFLCAVVDGITAYAGLETAGSTNLKVVKNGVTYNVKHTGFVAGNMEYRTPGTYTFTAPYTHDYTVTVAGGGGGGGGGAGYRLFKDHYQAGGNGGRGGLISDFVKLTAGVTYSITVGGGGAGGSNVWIGNRDDEVVGGHGISGGDSSACGLYTQGGGGGSGAIIKYFEDDGGGGKELRPGTPGASYGLGGLGGSGGYGQSGRGAAGAPGWVTITWS